MLSRLTKDTPKRAIKKAQRFIESKRRKRVLGQLLPKFVTPKNIAELRANSKPRRESAADRAALVIPVSRTGSIGDDAMFFALRDKLRKNGFEVDVLDLWEPGDVSHYDGVRAVIPAERYDFGDVNFWVSLLSGYQRMYFLGADTIDGVYNRDKRLRALWLVHIAAVLGLRSTVAGFSFNKTPNPQMIEMLNFVSSKIRFCLRDDFSRKRFNQLTNKRGVRVSDLAFMSETATKTQPTKKAIEWIREQGGMGRRVVGVNLSNQGNAESESIEKIRDAYRSELEQLLRNNKDVSVVLIQHDNRGTYSDYNILKMLYTSISSKYRSRLYFYDEIYPYPQAIRAIAKELNVSFTGRMHFAIACLGVGTPAASIVYQDKFEGMYKYFGLNKNKKLLLGLESIYVDGRIASTIEWLLREEVGLRESINRSLPSAIKLSERNL